uniref:Exostosin GT47 domain-containing protein n=1 Tax=Eutreptiella gymnastica TaxID=73025 RepID=A0A7S4CF04_9EUGL
MLTALLFVLLPLSHVGAQRHAPWKEELESKREAWSHKGWQCLQQTTPNIKLQYPADAEEHFFEIHRDMLAWAMADDHVMHGYAGYNGPWIENVWITHFWKAYTGLTSRKMDNTTRPRKRLSRVFGPFVPLLIAWTDFWVFGNGHYPTEMVAALRRVVRPNVPYITVSQNDQGITGHCELLMHDFPNILVLSAGGYGHIPVPLMTQPGKLKHLKPFEERQYLVSFVGTLDHAPNDLRQRMHQYMESHANQDRFNYTAFRGDGWEEVMRNSVASLTPRGFGRSAFHIAEAINMGLIPVYVYGETQWVPYEHMFHQFGFVVSVDNMDGWLKKFLKMGWDNLQKMEMRVSQISSSHFTFSGVMRQVGHYMLHKEPCDLQCQTLPPSRREAGDC